MKKLSMTKLNIYRRAYYQANHNKMLEQQLEWRNQNREAIAKRAKAKYYADIKATRKKANKYASEYRSKNLAQVVVLNRLVYTAGRRPPARTPRNVYWNKTAYIGGSAPYKVQFGVDGKDVHCGTYWTKADAKRAATAFRDKLKVRPPGMPAKYKFSQEEIDKVLADHKKRIRRAR